MDDKSHVSQTIPQTMQQITPQQIPFTLIHQLSQLAQNKNEELSNKQSWIKFNCRGTIIEANPVSIIKARKIQEVITCKEWTSQSVWRLDVRGEDFHLFLDYLSGLNKNAIKNAIVEKLCEEFEVDIDAKRRTNYEINNLILEIADHVNRNKDAFALISIPLDKSKTVHNHCLQFLIPSQLINKYEKYLNDFDELIYKESQLIDQYINFERDLRSIDGLVFPGKFKLIKHEGNYYIETECELLGNIVSQISQIIRCGNFKISDRTNKVIYSVKTECPIKWNCYLRNFSKEKLFDIFIPEYHWIQRSKPSEYPTVSVPSHIPFNGILCPVLNFVPERSRIKGYEYTQYPQVRILYNANLDKCEIELYKLEWKVNEDKKIIKGSNNNTLVESPFISNQKKNQIEDEEDDDISDIDDNMSKKEVKLLLTKNREITDKKGNDKLKELRLMAMAGMNNQKNNTYN